MVKKINLEPDDGKMTDAEQIKVGRELACAVRDLAKMREDRKAAIKELTEGIEAQQVEVHRLANLVRSGQRELFTPAPPPPVPDGKSAAAGEVAN